MFVVLCIDGSSTGLDHDTTCGTSFTNFNFLFEVTVFLYMMSVEFDFDHWLIIADLSSDSVDKLVRTKWFGVSQFLDCRESSSG